MSCYLWRLCGVQNLWTLEYLKTNALCIASVSYNTIPDNELLTLIAYYAHLVAQPVGLLLLSVKLKHYCGYTYLGI